MTTQNMIELTFTLLCLCLQHWSSALTCSGLTCHLNEAEYNDAVNTHDTARACHILNLTADCLHDLLVACEQNLDWKKKYLSSAKNLITEIQHRQYVICDNSPSPTLCADIGLCTKYVEQTKEAIDSNKDKQACGETWARQLKVRVPDLARGGIFDGTRKTTKKRSIEDSVRCLREAVAECSQSDVIEAAAMDNYTAILKHYENTWTEICLNVYSVQGQVVTSVQSLSVNSDSSAGLAERSTHLRLLSFLLVIFNLISRLF